MLRFTAGAAEHLVRLREERHLQSGVYPRFVRRDGRLRLTFTMRPGSGDRIVDGGRIAAIVAPSAADILESSTIDVAATEGVAHLTIRRDTKSGRSPRRTAAGRATG
jgi:Fe-S cluster assembly iron-binding protein IscA